ncbi:MAG: TetR/AcrR family transcriptional regulator [Candidatus Hydrogenedentales bacterium]|jgi:AcrR family transcriptional regulator
MGEQTEEGTHGNVFRGKRGELLQRDELFFETARRIFLEEGIHELTISKLADLTGFSRATLYDRFGSKEGLLVELGIECQLELRAMLQRAAGYPGGSREQIQAVSIAMHDYSARYSDSMRIVATIGDESIASRVSEAKQARMREIDTDMFRILLRIVHRALDEGDLKLPAGFRPEALCLVIWAMADGCAAAMRGSAPLEEFGIQDPLGELMMGGPWFLDGWGWRPLSSDWDYEGSMVRIRAFLDGEAPSESKATPVVE